MENWESVCVHLFHARMCVSILCCICPCSSQHRRQRLADLVSVKRAQRWIRRHSGHSWRSLRQLPSLHHGQMQHLEENPKRWLPDQARPWLITTKLSSSQVMHNSYFNQYITQSISRRLNPLKWPTLGFKQFPGSYLAVRRGVNPVMVDSPLVAQGNGPLSGAALALSDQEAPVDARAEQVLRCVARYGAVVPAVLLQAVDRGDVVGRHPSLAVLGLCLTPLAIVVVTQHTQLLS